MPPLNVRAALRQPPRDRSLAEHWIRAVLLLNLALPCPEDSGPVDPDHAGPVDPDVGPGPDGGRRDFLRAASAWRTELESFNYVHWEDSRDDALLHFSRPYGWHCVANFGRLPVPVPEGIVVISSGAVQDGCLPPATTVWLLRWVE
ncbi:hypothetical protein [Arthrobacter sp. 135MFCol5.1]|uniref:hypothetical protein n=1 Tax=Arthrobacter sp. 135MFCol5.1 TaxID=1158050 RepID=UPI0012DD58E8|nr:hypothetical protein [Arthrobacter sp. 135MFCol5.1]